MQTTLRRRKREVDPFNNNNDEKEHFKPSSTLGDWIYHPLQ